MSEANSLQERVFDQFTSYVDYNHLDKAEQMLTEMKKNSLIKPSTIKECYEYLRASERRTDEYVYEQQMDAVY